ncbi:MAG: hypothetical protein ACETWM_16555 [Candidatus Lokiarchaeia archaeon]
MKVYVPLKQKKNPGATMWVAKVGYESNVAFYAISDDMDELYESINQKAKNHYSGLMDLEKSFINVKKARLGEVDIPENLVNSATRKIEEKDFEDVRIPPSILVPLEMELVPVVNFDPEDVDPEFSRFVKPRNILSKEEIRFLNNLDGRSKLILTAEEDLLVWQYQKGEEKVDYDALNGRRLEKGLTN